MSADSGGADGAFRVADRLRTPVPWEVYAERIRRYEVHLNGASIEMIRGPVALEGYGVRVLRPREGKLGAGFQASTDFSEAGIAATVEDAESIARHSEFPARSVALPSAAGAGPAAEVVDRRLWQDPLGTVEAYVAELLARFEGRAGVVASFGSVRATLSEATIANSAGLRAAFAHTTVDLEIDVKAYRGPEGAPPGEYWVNASGRRLEPERLRTDVDHWCRFAADVRRAVPPPTGELPVVLPAGVLAGILPSALGIRFTGPGRLRQIAPEVGSPIAAEGLRVHDDGLVPWAPGSAPYDDEGAARGRRTLIEGGKVAGLLYDSLHAAAFDTGSTASASRATFANGFTDWRRFAHSPQVALSTLAVAPGPGGSDAELVEAAQDGVWVQQLGWAVPDPISGAFGGEIRIGYRIRNGRLAEPVRGGTVGGFAMAPPGKPSLLADVRGIGSHPTLTEGVFAPTLLVRPLVVAGAVATAATS